MFCPVKGSQVNSRHIQLFTCGDMRPWLSIIGGSVAKELWMLRTPIPPFTTLD